MTLSPPLADALDSLANSPQVELLGSQLGVMEGLPVAAAAWVAETLGRRLDRPLLVVVPHDADGLAWVESAELVGASAAYFSSPSLSPYQETDPSLQVRAVESATLHQLLSGQVRTVVCTPRALFRLLPTPEGFRSALVEIEPGGEISMSELLDHLARFGYQRTDLVSEVGDFAVRGGIFDVFPPGVAGPVRLDLFGDTVESVREFDKPRIASECRRVRLPDHNPGVAAEVVKPLVRDSKRLIETAEQNIGFQHDLRFWLHGQIVQKVDEFVAA